MKRGWLLAIIPPAIVVVVALLLFPSGYVSDGGWIAIGFLLVAYLTLITLPSLAPKSEESFIFSGSYALVVYPYLIVTAIIALIAAAIPGISWKWVLAADIVVTGVATFVVVGVTSASEKDARSQAATKRQVDDLRVMALTVDQYGKTVSDPAEATFARKVAEQLRLSPFLGVSASVDVEADIASAVGELRHLSPEADPASVHSALEQISSLVKHRNELVKFAR